MPGFKVLGIDNNFSKKENQSSASFPLKIILPCYYPYSFLAKFSTGSFTSSASINPSQKLAVNFPYFFYFDNILMSGVIWQLPKVRDQTLLSPWPGWFMCLSLSFLCMCCSSVFAKFMDGQHRTKDHTHKLIIFYKMLKALHKRIWDM